MIKLTSNDFKALIKADSLNKIIGLASGNIRYTSINSFKCHTKEIEEIINQLPELWQKFKKENGI